MRTTDYTTARRGPSGNPPRELSEQSDSITRRIRAALIAGGSSLRLWAHFWAEQHGRDPQGTYDLLRMTLRRRVERGLPPQGAVGQALIASLRADLGADVVPLPADADPVERAA